MQTRSPVAWMLEHEARALLTRLDRVRPFALHETMVPAAALSPAAQLGIERFLLDGRRELRRRILGYLEWLRSDGRGEPPDELQRRFTVVRWRFNDVLSQFDLFQEVITQRSEHQTGVQLSGLDVAAQEALTVPGAAFEVPPIVCYLDRGPGAAIRRARTRLPGGGQNPVAVVRVPRERMIGHGIASSLVHEVGHQAAALLDLVESLREVLARVERVAGQEERPAWRLWSRWLSEIVPDLWSVGKLGIASTLGLIGVVSLPRWFVFRLNVDDPHPFPWIRVRLSCAIGQALYPHRQWTDLAATWTAMYPPVDLSRERRRALAGLEATMPALVELLVDHRPVLLGGRSLREAMPLAERTPARLAAYHRDWSRRPGGPRAVPPTLAFAVLGQARAAGRIAPEAESRMLSGLLSHWALRSTLDTLTACTSPPAVPAPATVLVP